MVIRIKKHERGLWFRHGDFQELVGPGQYLFLGRYFLGDEVEIFSTLETRFEHPLLDVLLEAPTLRSELVTVDLTDDQRAFVWKAGRLAYILGPGRHAFWKQPLELEIEIHSMLATRFSHPRMEAILAHPDAGTFFDAIYPEAGERVLFFREGEQIDSSDAGLNVFWKQAAELSWKSVNLREQIADVAGQEIMTSDKVTLRVNLVVTYQVIDAVKAVEVVEDYAGTLYREAQLALRASVGARSLDDLLTDKQAAGSEVLVAIAERAAEFGIVVKSVGLRDLILPGDMKTILNRVIEAEKEAQANVIRRREETAAARSQANTARLLADNPALARMKELEAVQDILAGTKATFLFGQGDLVHQVKSLGSSASVEED